MKTKTIQIAKINVTRNYTTYTLHRGDGEIIVKAWYCEVNKDGYPTMRKRIVKKFSGIDGVSNALMWVAEQAKW